jgi:hypothetical protein
MAQVNEIKELSKAGAGKLGTTNENLTLAESTTNSSISEYTLRLDLPAVAPFPPPSLLLL